MYYTKYILCAIFCFDLHLTNTTISQTLPSKRKPQNVTVTETSEPTPATSVTDTIIEIPNPPSQPLSVKELLSIPILRAVFASSGALGFFGSCFNNVFVLMAYSPLDQGGLALSVRPPSPGVTPSRARS